MIVFFIIVTIVIIDDGNVVYHSSIEIITNNVPARIGILNIVTWNK